VQPDAEDSEDNDDDNIEYGNLEEHIGATEESLTTQGFCEVCRKPKLRTMKKKKKHVFVEKSYTPATNFALNVYCSVFNTHLFRSVPHLVQFEAMIRTTLNTYVNSQQSI
jgi:hypothetical protein